MNQSNQINSYEVLGYIASFLYLNLEGLFFSNAYKISDAEIALCFRFKDKYFTLKLNFTDYVLFSFERKEFLSRKSSLFQTHLSNQKVENIFINEQDRIIKISLEANAEILLFCFGRNGNISFSNGLGSLVSFRSNFKSQPYSKIISFVFPNKTTANFPYQVIKYDESIQLEKVDGSDVLLEDTINYFYRNYLSLKNRLNSFKAHKKQLETKISSVKRQLKNVSNYTIELQNKTPFNHVADLILSNLHLFVCKPDLPCNQQVFDYMANKEIDIIIPANILPQVYADKLYKKHKNQSKELTFLEQKRASLLAELSILELKIASLNLEKFNPKQGAKKITEKEGTNQTAIPFIEFEGYKIYYGKKAKDNDYITFKLGAKDDYWLHAYGVSGSHVLVKSIVHTKKEPSKVVIEKAASIAAFNSKAKGSSWVAVMVTQRKFVIKPKKAELGEVKVLKYSTINVTPDIS